MLDYLIQDITCYLLIVNNYLTTPRAAEHTD